MQEKTLDATSTADSKEKVSDVKVVGNPDMLQLLCKASSKSEGWMKSLKAIQVHGGCIVQASTQQGNQVAEAITFVPGVKIAEDINGGNRLVGD